jgi:uncharacterized membrane protein (UPF0127 family)
MAGAFPNRFEGAPRASVLGLDAVVAADRRLRLLGLMGLPREAAPPALLIPRCSAVHTFWMRFPLDLVFLAGDGTELDRMRGVAPRRLARRRGAHAVLEIPA